MRSIFRFNGTETVVENKCPVDGDFNKAIFSELIKVFGANVQFRVKPVANFKAPEKTDEIFQAIIMGHWESEAPIQIDVYDGLDYDVNGPEAPAELPEPNLVVPAFIGFRKN